MTAENGDAIKMLDGGEFVLNGVLLFILSVFLCSFGGLLYSIDWFEGIITGKSHVSWEIHGFL